MASKQYQTETPVQALERYAKQGDETAREYLQFCRMFAPDEIPQSEFELRCRMIYNFLRRKAHETANV